MSFRLSLNKISKEELSKLRRLTLTELRKSYSSEDEEFFPNAYEIPLETIIYISDDFNYEHLENLFSKKEPQQILDNSETVLKVISKENLLELILFYEKLVHNYYSKMLEKIDKGSPNVLAEIRMSFEHSKINWGANSGEKYGLSPLNLDKDDHRIVRSDLYEYDIFELNNLYKHFDFNNNSLILSGY